MGVCVTIHNDLEFPVEVAIRLKGGIRLCSNFLGPGEAWIKRDGGLSATCPYDLWVRQADSHKRVWIRHMVAPSVQSVLTIKLSKIAVNEWLKQIEPVGKNSKQSERASIAKKWVKDEERGNCQLCKREFSLYWRKHHCRICGDIFCDHCSRFKVLTALHPSMPARACYWCFEKQAMKNKEEKDLGHDHPSKTDDSTELKQETLLEQPLPCAPPPTPRMTPYDRLLRFLEPKLVDVLALAWKSGPAGRVLAPILVCWVFLLAYFLFTSWRGLFNFSSPLGYVGWILISGVLLLVGVAFRNIRRWRERAAKIILDGIGKKAGRSRRSSSLNIPSPIEEEVKEFTPEEEKWMELGSESVEKLWEWTLSHSGWVKKHTGDIEVWSEEKPSRKGGIRAFKAMAVVNASAREVAKLLADAEKTPEWNPALKQYRTIREITSSCHITYALGAPTGPISARDFVQVRSCCYKQPTSPKTSKRRLRKPYADSKGEEKYFMMSSDSEDNGPPPDEDTNASGCGGYIIANHSIEGAGVESKKNVVRGDAGPNGYVILEGAGKETDQKRCRVLW
eukprot:CAMPEP_0167757168 /NCGR_PEP_ID=MMETSP0110_2-20121227/9779_1 /TAXON_ID=629695 /ORGANISM="Gymnochlora sp., Strain CCMP2014" /LENGTH=562 /DNA_ID=CAMNT_0007643335 /DNA_START=85 /DNA_END=1770 /DNA_ORIENTATION=-